MVASEIGRTFDSLNRGVFIAHEVMFSWPGSNVQISDIEDMVAQLGVQSGLGAVNTLWDVVDPARTKDSTVNKIVESFALPRHRVAHDVNAIPDAIEVGGVTRNVRIASLLVDACISLAIVRMREGKSTGGALLKSIGGGVKVRRVDRDGAYWSERGPGKKRAYKRYATLQEAMAQAVDRARQNTELLVAYDAESIVDWSAFI
ncbi:hypothetical protein ACFWQK_14405 [Brachybacterium paraconglomeratum]